jgi:hypothetical protein
MLLHLSYGYIVGEDSGEQDVAIARAKKVIDFVPNQPMLNLYMSQAFDNFAELTRPGRFLVEVLPFLRHIPSWMPGAEFKRFATRCAETVNQAKESPFIWAEKQIKSGNARESFTRDILEAKPKELTAQEKDDIEWTLFSIFAGS